MHRMLERQIAHHLPGATEMPPEFRALLEAISDTYTSFDEDQLMLDRSLELSSKEFSENSQALRDAKAHIEQTVEERTDELHKEHAKLLASVNSLSVGILIMDANEHIFVANDATAAILELPAFSASSLGFDGIADSLACVPDFRDYCRRTIRENTKQEIKDVVCNEKHLRMVFSPVTLLKDPSSAIGAVLLLEDITEAKVLEQSRDEFFSIASHELRTPLTAIKGNSSMLLEYYGDKMADADMRQMVDDMFVSSERLIKIVNDFLDVSRLELGRLKVTPESFMVAPLIQKTLDELKDLARLKQITLEFPDADHAPASLVFADPARVKQVLMKLIGNAINYSPNGTVTLSFGVVDENLLKISIKDTGVGIAKDQESFLFRKFQQIGEKIHSRDVMSTGLGLYITRLIVELMGGTIWLEESELGKGSTFSFTLPLAR